MVQGLKGYIIEYGPRSPAYLLKDGKGQLCERCKGGKFVNCLRYRCSKGSLVQSAIMTAEMYYRNHKWHPAKEIDGIIFVSNFSKQKHVEFDRRFTESYTMVLYNTPGEKVKESLDKSVNTFNSYYLFYGRLSVEKGISTLLKSIEKYPQLPLKIVGTGPLEEELKNFCCEKGLINVEFLGYKSGKELFDLVAGAKYVCAPSECYENNPMTIVEAYSLATPVIGAAIGGISEIIKEGETGFLFESGAISSLENAIEKSLAVSENEYSLIKKNAYQFAKANFDSEKYYEMLVGFYQNVIKKFNSSKD